MRIWQYFKRKKLHSWRMGSHGVPGLRVSSICHFFETPIRPYRGPFDRHLLVFVTSGYAVFRRDGETVVVRPTQTLLIQPGPGSLEIISSTATDNFSAYVVEFTIKSVAKYLRKSFRAESAALQPRPFPKTGALLYGLHVRSFPLNPQGDGNRFDPDEMFETLFNCYSAEMSLVTREMFYEKRWEVLRFLEGYVLWPLSDLTWQARYGADARQLHKDCQFYVGCAPEVFMKRRKTELASAWLRCRRSVEEIAKGLGFASVWEFKCLYSAMSKRNCEDVRDEGPLWELSDADIEEAISPFWWSRVRSESVEHRHWIARQVIRNLAEAAHESRFEEIQLAQQCTPQTESRFAELIAALDASTRFWAIAPEPNPGVRKYVEDFRQMKTTAVENVVPFLKDLPVSLSQAA